jgi:ABC-type sulfate transport system permease component
MEPILIWISDNAVLAVGIGAFLCGVSLMYLVMQRTLKHRQKEEGLLDQS